MDKAKHSPTNDWDTNAVRGVEGELTRGLCAGPSCSSR